MSSANNYTSTTSILSSWCLKLDQLYCSTCFSFHKFQTVAVEHLLANLTSLFYLQPSIFNSFPISSSLPECLLSPVFSSNLASFSLPHFFFNFLSVPIIIKLNLKFGGKKMIVLGKVRVCVCVSVSENRR